MEENYNKVNRENEEEFFYLGDSYGKENKFIPYPKTNKEWFERMIQFPAQKYFESSVRLFQHDFPVLTENLLKQELKKIDDLIERANNYDISTAMRYTSHKEDEVVTYSRIVNGYYVKYSASLSFGSPESSVYAKCFLFRDWLFAQLNSKMMQDIDDKMNFVELKESQMAPSNKDLSIRQLALLYWYNKKVITSSNNMDVLLENESPFRSGINLYKAYNLIKSSPESISKHRFAIKDLEKVLERIKDSEGKRQVNIDLKSARLKKT